MAKLTMTKAEADALTVGSRCVKVQGTAIIINKADNGTIKACLKLVVCCHTLTWSFVWILVRFLLSMAGAPASVNKRAALLIYINMRKFNAFLRMPSYPLVVCVFQKSTNSSVSLHPHPLPAVFHLFSPLQQVPAYWRLVRPGRRGCGQGYHEVSAPRLEDGPVEYDLCLPWSRHIRQDDKHAGEQAPTPAGGYRQ
jgi:hypothetical protein